MSRRYPSRPVVGVSGVVLWEDKVLLVKRGSEPAKGLWSIPGGALELGESLAEGCAREIREETGIEVEVGALVEVVERLSRDESGRVEYHYVLLDYICTCEGGAPRAASDAADARWTPLAELRDEGLTSDTQRVILKAAAMANIQQ